jgi:hypothetical protein
VIRSRFDSDDDDFNSLKILGVCGLVLLISLWFAWTEMRYLIFADIATARVIEADIVETSGRRGRRIQKLFVEYQFTEEDGTHRSEDDRAAADFPLPNDGTVEVQYIPGVADDSRLSGNSNQWSLYVVGVCFVLAGVMLWKLIREANSPIPTSRRSTGPTGRGR